MRPRVCLIGILLSAVSILGYIFYERPAVWRNPFLVSDRKQVLLKAYFRGGSTFLGSMFKSNPDVYYYYEPLHALSFKYYWGILDNVTYLNGSTISIEDRDKTIQGIVSKVLSCRYGDLWYEVLTDKTTVDMGSRQYAECLGGSRTIPQVKMCLPILNKQCKNHSIVATKTIRFPMRLAESLISDQSVMVLHQVRDPRPSLNSQMKSNFIKPDQLKSVATRWCTEMYEDVRETQRLYARHPGSVKLVYYEHITLHTKRIVREICDFLGIPFPKEVRRHIEKLRSFDNQCFMCLGRSDPLRQLNKWRTEIKFEHVKIIDESCAKLYKLLGYTSAKTENNLRDLSYPLFTHPIDIVNDIQ